VREKEIRSSIVLGGYGVNLSFSAVVQETPSNLLFLNEQIRTYDSRFAKFTEALVDIPGAFSKLSDEERKLSLEAMSRMSTMLHEFSHPVHPADSDEGSRLGGKPLTTIDEVKADALWRPLVPHMIEQGFDGTPEQWAMIALAGSLMLIKDQPDDDPYYAAGIYGLNGLFEKGIAKFENGKILVTDVRAYYEATKEMALEISDVYEDATMTEHKAAAWIKKRCVPSETLKKVITFVKTLPY
jgi:hypothetical protein